MRQLAHEITQEDVGRAFINMLGRSWLVQNFMGIILPGDVGKRIYYVPCKDGYGGVLQVENDDQRDARLGKLEVEGYAGH